MDSFADMAAAKAAIVDPGIVDTNFIVEAYRKNNPGMPIEVLGSMPAVVQIPQRDLGAVFSPKQPSELAPGLFAAPEQFRHLTLEEYEGPVVISQAQLASMLPGYTPPDKEAVFARKILVQDPYYGSMPAAESSTLLGIVSVLRPRVILEIGTHLGLTFRDLMKAAPADTLGFSIDLPVSQWHQAKFRHNYVQAYYVRNCAQAEIGKLALEDAALTGRIAIFQADSGRFPFEHFRGKVDLVVVDGNHSCRGALHDMEQAFSMVAPGGVIAIDDYAKPPRLGGVTYAVDHFAMMQGRRIYTMNHSEDGKYLTLPDGKQLPNHLALFFNV
jgi:predicted O-methyltransferase YrrM